MKTIFVSSTFKDMQFERDAIRNIALPEINKEARKHNDEFDFCDLRWGINTEEMDSDTAAKKVLDVCLDEIDRCRPPMIVILGCRYGWIPPTELIKTVSERKDFQIQDLQRSVTALEVEYGALASAEKIQNTLFYFREIEGEYPKNYAAEDPEHEAKIQQLKSRIYELTGGRIKTYKVKWKDSKLEGINDFANLVASDIIEYFKDEWIAKDKMSPNEREMDVHRAFLVSKRKLFKARLDDADNILNLFEKQKTTVICGDVGSGKSTLISYLSGVIENSGWIVVPFVSGLTSSSCDALDIIKSIVCYLEEKNGTECFDNSSTLDNNRSSNHTLEEWIDKLSEVTYKFANAGNKLAIVIDAVDQLNDNETRNDMLFIPRSVGDNIHVLISCTKNFRTPGYDRYELEPLTKNDRLNVIRGICASNRRDLTQSVIDEMLNNEASDNPLYLSLLVQRLLLMNGDDYNEINNLGGDIKAIEYYQKKLLRTDCPKTLDGMSASLLTEVGKRVDSEIVSKVADYLSVSRHGLRKKDFAAIFSVGWKDLTFSHFINYLSDCFILRNDGRYDFAHKSFRTGFRSLCVDEKQVNKSIANYLKGLDDDDPIRKSEIIYHVIMDDDSEYFTYYISKYTDADNKTYIEAAAKATYDCAMLDGGNWLISLLNSEANGDVSSALTEFVYKELYKYNHKTKRDVDLFVKIHTASVNLAERIHNVSPTSINKTDLLMSYRKLHTILAQLNVDDDNDEDNMIQLELKSIAVAEELCTLQDNIENAYQLAVEYAWLACSYCGLASMYSANHETSDCAIAYFNKAKDILERIVSQSNEEKHRIELAWLYCDLGRRYYHKKGDRDHKLELEFSEKGVTLFEKIYDEHPTSQNARSLASAYHYLAEAYRMIYRNEDLSKSIQCVEKSINLLERHYSASEWIETTSLLSYSYFQLAFFHEIMSETYTELNAENKIAQEFYWKCIHLREELFNELLSPESGRDLAWSYNRIAIHYRNRVSDINSAIKAQMCCFEIYEKLHSMYPTKFLADKIGDCMARIADDYYSLDGKENIEESIEYYFKAIDYLRNEAGKDNFAYYFNQIAKAYYKIGGNENKNESLKYFCLAFENYDKFKRRTQYLVDTMLQVYDFILKLDGEGYKSECLPKFAQIIEVLMNEKSNYPRF